MTQTINITSRPWTRRELSRLRKMYPTAHWSELIEAFPNRTKKAVKRTAEKEKIRRTGPRKTVVMGHINVLVRKRKKRKIPLETFAKVCGYSPKIIENWEIGAAYPDKFQYQCYRDTLERFDV